MSLKYGVWKKRGQFPSPNTYNLPSVMGYKKHDITKPTSPAYTHGIRREEAIKRGAEFLYIKPGMTRFGKDNNPAFSFGIRREGALERTPGPSDYSPIKRGQTVPKYTFGIKHGEYVGFYVSRDN
jgi:hypothetical protein